MKTMLVVAPHPDDETLGCGGTILRYKDEGYQVHWMIVTGIGREDGYSKQQIKLRDQEIQKVTMLYGFKSVHELKYPAASLDVIPKVDVISSISNVVRKVKPEQVLTVYRNDAHSDHEVVFDAVMSATKTFRHPSVKRVMAYETVSETDYGLKPGDGGFRPNVYIDISRYLERKLEIFKVYKSEVGEFPFPRSEKAISALASVRGAQSNCNAAESFMLIKEIL